MTPVRMMEFDDVFSKMKNFEEKEKLTKKGIDLSFGMIVTVPEFIEKKKQIEDEKERIRTTGEKRRRNEDHDPNQPKRKRRRKCEVVEETLEDFKKLRNKEISKKYGVAALKSFIGQISRNSLSKNGSKEDLIKRILNFEVVRSCGTSLSSEIHNISIGVGVLSKREKKAVNYSEGRETESCEDEKESLLELK